MRVRIADERKRQGWSIRQFASALGICHATLLNWEADPEAYRLGAVARSVVALDIPICELIIVERTPGIILPRRHRRVAADTEPQHTQPYY
jgi:transcriptional regulator with XRE-family HTH domain